jgi:hypothetical protein
LQRRRKEWAGSLPLAALTHGSAEPDRYPTQVTSMTDADKHAMLTTLDQMIRSVAPEVSTVSKYGGTLYTLYPDENERQFCGIFAYSSHVQLSFARCAELDDPFDILAGNGKLRRHINFARPDDLDSRTITTLVRSATALEN